MAAIQQRVLDSSRKRTDFIESMEEERRRVAEHLELRSSIRRPSEKTRNYSFSGEPQSGSGDEAGDGPRRRATVNHQVSPRRFATIGSHYAHRPASTPPPSSSQRPSPPRSVPPDGKQPNVFPEFVAADLQNGAFGEEEVSNKPQANAILYILSPDLLACFHVYSLISPLSPYTGRTPPALASHSYPREDPLPEGLQPAAHARPFPASRTAPARHRRPPQPHAQGDSARQGRPSADCRGGREA